MASSADKYQIFQRNDGSVWWVRFSIPGEGQIRKSLATHDEGEAERKAAKVWHDAMYRHEHGMRAVQRSFRVVAEEYVEHAHQMSRTGEKRADRGKRIEGLVRRYFIPFFQEKQIDAIRDQDVTRYWAWRKTYWTEGPGKNQMEFTYVRKGKVVRNKTTQMRGAPSLSTQRGEAVVLSELFKQSIKWGYLGKGLAPEIKASRVPPSPRPSFSADEMALLMRLATQRAFDPTVNEEVRRDRTILLSYVSIASLTGLRPTEMKNLNWGDVLGYREGLSKKLRDRDIRIRCRGKGKSREAVPLELALAYFDALWRQWQKDHGTEPSDSDPVFASKARKRITKLNKSLNSLLDVASLKRDHRDKPRDAYSFRHFYISQQLLAGVDVFALARNAGTSPDMIDKHYGQVSNEQMRETLRPQWK
ncbi:MAG: hypothetical protein JWL96_1923 [Sphingomonas bacterium]|uniref:tyrosine-type recombinase/integrase n=1 Tax=Sphingomonas bacterium TaxID=1895847 RepID=UPI00262BA573|nr:tyrosine-type recombinase/integrase [Sphingomonas bacterium]MDB5709853.1 hypothetical protein [Sphingomonas bacterium]